jgi:hypothetical protein
MKPMIMHKSCHVDGGRTRGARVGRDWLKIGKGSDIPCRWLGDMVMPMIVELINKEYPKCSDGIAAASCINKLFLQCESSSFELDMLSQWDGRLSQRKTPDN